MLILSARNTLNLALGHNATAAEALLGGHAMSEQQPQQDQGAHFWRSEGDTAV